MGKFFTFVKSRRFVDMINNDYEGEEIVKVKIQVELS